MKTAIVATTLALTSSVLAAPFPKAQAQIQTLQIQITTVINDIVQSSSTLGADYDAGLSQFGTLSNRFDGPQPCSPFVPGQPSTKKQAIKALQSSQSALIELSLDLQNPALTIANSDFHADVCTAQAYYSAISQFVGA